MRKKIELNMTPMDVMLTMAEGNPGAISAMTSLMEDGPQGIFDVLHLDDMNMRGPQVWVAYKDFCGGNTKIFREKIRARDKEMISFVNTEMFRDPSWSEIATPNGGSWRK